MALQAWAEDLELSCLQSIVCIDIVLNCTLSSAAAMQMYIINTLYLILHFTLPFTCPNSIYSVRLKILHPVRRMLCTTQHNYVNSLPFSLSLSSTFFFCFFREMQVARRAPRSVSSQTSCRIYPRRAPAVPRSTRAFRAT